MSRDGKNDKSAKMTRPPLEQRCMTTEIACELQDLDLPDAELLFWERVDLGCDSDALLQRLIDDCHWQEETVTLFGKTYPQPRLIAWYGDAGTDYTYSGTRHVPLPWTNQLLQLRDRVQQLTGSPYNSVPPYKINIGCINKFVRSCKTSL